MIILNNTLFSKNYILLFIINTLVCVGFYMLMPVLPVYAVHDIGLEQGKVGLVVGLFAISSVMIRPFCGFFMDRYGRMVIYLPAIIIFTICFGSYIFALTVSSLLILRLIHGFSWGAANTAMATLVADVVPKKYRSTGIGYFGLSMTVAMAIGPSLGAALLDKFSIKAIFLLSMILCVVGVVLSFALRPPNVKKEITKFSMKNLLEKRVAGLAFIEFFFGLIYASLMAYAVLHAIEIKVTVIGLFFLAYAISMAVTRPLGGKLMEMYGATPLITGGLLLFGVGLLFTAFAETNAPFLVSGIFLGIGSGFLMPTIMTMAVNVVSAERRGAANATILTALDIGIGLGAVVFGKVAEWVGYEKMYAISAALLIIPLLIYFFNVMSKYEVMKQEMENMS